MATIHWKSAVSGLFSNASDWSTGSVPGSTDAAFIDATGASYTVSVTSTTESVGTLTMVAPATLDIVASTFSLLNGSDVGGLAGTIIDENSSDLRIGGTIANSGTIQENAGANTTYFILTSNVSLQGGGKLQLIGTGADNYLYGVSGSTVLDNVNNTISGTGNLGDGQLTLTNEAAGVINANAATALTLNTGSNYIVNNGLLTSTAAGGLVLDSVVDQRVGGQISSAGGVVEIGSTVIGGTLSGTLLQDTGTSGGLDGLATHAVTNAGTLKVLDSTYFYLAGTIDNTGEIFQDATLTTGTTTNLIVSGAVNELTGGGKLVLSDDFYNRIYATNGNYELINVNNVISGAGQLGTDQLHFINEGTVDATGTNELQLWTTANYLTNTGLLESTNPNSLAAPGGLQIYDTPIVNAGGTILASGAHSHVDLSTSATIIGGTLETAAGGVIQTIAGTNYLDGQTDGAISNTGTVLVNNATVLYLAGSIVNTGTINVDATTTNNTDLVINGGFTTLSGGGTVLLSDDLNNRIYAGNNTLVNFNNLIEGAGQIGVDQTSFTNDAAGIVDASGINELQIYSNNYVVHNTGLFEATNTTVGSGGLQIYNTTVNNQGGTIEPVGTNASVNLSAGYLEGGIVGAAGGGVVFSLTGTTNTLDGTTAGVLTVKGTLQVEDNSVLQLVGTIVNDGTIFDDSVNTNTNTDLHVVGNQTTLTGGGQITLSDSDNNRLYGTGTLDNINNVISGAGNIGIGQSQLTLYNQAGGVIDANQVSSTTTAKSGALYLDTGSGTPVTNLGLLESTNTGGLRIYGTNVYNAGGTVEANGAGAVVELQSGGTITGGTLLTSGAGAQIGVLSGSTGRLDGQYQGAITLNGVFQVNDTAVLQLYGALVNKGTLSQDAVTTGTNTDIELVGQGATLSGGGSVTLSNDTYNRIYGYSTQLVNVDNTISGTGQIGLGISTFTFVNEAKGVIDANQVEVTGSTSTTGLLTIDCGSNTTYGGLPQNAGLIEATAGGHLLLEGTAILNTGTLTASGTNSLFDLDGSTVVGGTITDSAGGLMRVVVGSASGLDGVSSGPVTNTGVLAVEDEAQLNLAGTINNIGTIEELGTTTTSNTNIELTNALVTLTGGGSVILSNFANNRIYGAASTYELDNVNNTIEGAGQLGVAQLTLLNTGLIDANQTLALNLNTGSQLLNNAAGGTLEGTGAGGLIVNSGILINNGAIIAGNASNVTFQSSVTNSNADGLGELAGGTWEAISTGGGATLSITGGPVVIDSANIVLSGAGSVFQAGNGSTFTTLETSLTTITSSGTLQVLGGRGFTTTDTISDQGVLVLSGGTFSSAGVLTVGPAGILRGSGVVKPAVVSSGLLDAQGGGTLALTGAVTSTGSLEADAGSVLQLNEAALTTITTGVTLNGVGSDIQFGTASPFTSLESSLTTIASTGTFAVLGSRGYVTTKGLTDNGLFKVAGGTFTAGSLALGATGQLVGTGTVTTNVTGAGTITSSGGLLTLSGGVTGTTKLVVNAGGSTLELGASSSVGAVTVSGRLKLDGNTYTATSLTVNAASRIYGFGTITNAVANSGTIESNGGPLKLAAGATGTGTLQVDAGSTLELAAASTAGAITVSGRLKLDGNTYTATTETVNANSRIYGFGTITNSVGNSGTIESNGGLLKLSAGATGTGVLQVDAGSTLELAAATTAGVITDAGTLKLDGANTTTTGLTVVSTGTVTGLGTITGPVSNAGDITATSGTLTVAGSLTETGTLNAAASATLAASHGGTISGSITGTGTLSLSGTSTFTTSGALNVNTAVINAANVTIGSGSLSFLGAMTNNDIIATGANTASFSDSVGGTGTITVGAGGTASLLDGSAAGETLNFLAASGAIDLGTPLSFAGTIGGFALGNTIDLLSTIATGETFASNVLTLTNGATTVATLDMTGSYTTSSFHLGTDSHGGTLITHT